MNDFITDARLERLKSASNTNAAYHVDALSPLIYTCPPLTERRRHGVDAPDKRMDKQRRETL
jgi:hypothetical protein